MYKTILMPLDGTPTDRAIIDHIKELAKLAQSRVVLFHVATGVPAQYHGSDAAGKEIDEDSAYLAGVRAEFEALSIPATAELAYGNPAKEILLWLERNECDLVAMSTHGHQFVGDLVFGTTAIRVQHRISVPVLLLRAK
ncbi:MAG: universal stress protein [Phycisphaerales bacterium]|nr:universal stress protein [Phycisphaerales bacterium]MCB9856189.1 universal stress protein [Phycisphaerales bacterium]MCB9863371.1 universal stress protein [Phycisphaerales bacterium]